MTDNGMTAADIAAVTDRNNGFGGDGSWWLIVLFLFAMMGGNWGNNGGFGGNYVTQAELQAGLNQQTLQTGQNDILQQLNNIAMNQQNCCCENRQAIADLKYTVATEACADRQSVSNALRDVIAANTASTQRILDQLCQDKIDQKNEEIANLRTQLNMANLSASQTAQTAQILRDNAAQTVALEQYLNPVPVPAYVVANPNCCNNWNSGCGCGVA